MNVNLASMVENNNDGLVYPLPDSTELVIERTIEGIQRMITINPPSQGEGKDGGTDTGKEFTTIEISLAMKRHWESEIKILRDAPRDAEKLREILKVK